MPIILPSPQIRRLLPICNASAIRAKIRRTYFRIIAMLSEFSHLRHMQSPRGCVPAIILLILVISTGIIHSTHAQETNDNTSIDGSMNLKSGDNSEFNVYKSEGNIILYNIPPKNNPHVHKAKRKVPGEHDRNITRLLSAANTFLEKQSYDEMGSAVAQVKASVEISDDEYTQETERRIAGLLPELKVRAEDLWEAVDSQKIANAQKKAAEVRQNLDNAAAWQDKCPVSSMNHYYQVIRTCNKINSTR